MSDRATSVDPLFPSLGLLPMSVPGGGAMPLRHAGSGVRPYSATLGVAPLECGKHETTATRWTEAKPTQKSDDGKVYPDTVGITHTDT